MYGEKIRTIRELRGYSQEYMAHELQIAQNSYSRIETGQSKLSADNLQKIATILGVSVTDIMSPKPSVISFKSEINYTETIDKIIAHQQNLVETIISIKEKEIEQLKDWINELITGRKTRRSPIE